MDNYVGKLNAVYFRNEFGKKREKPGVPVDKWSPASPEEVIINCIQGFFIAPISIFGNIRANPNEKFDYFMLSINNCCKIACLRLMMLSCSSFSF